MTRIGSIPVNDDDEGDDEEDEPGDVKRGAPAFVPVLAPLPAEELGHVVGAREAESIAAPETAKSVPTSASTIPILPKGHLRGTSATVPSMLWVDRAAEAGRPRRSSARTEDPAERVAEEHVGPVDAEVLRFQRSSTAPEE